MRFYLALWAAKLCAVVIRLVAKDRGTNLPGELALKLDPKFVTHIKGLDPAKAVFITGTNGKSTSTNMIHHVLQHSGRAVTANLMGANLLSGVATALIADCTLGGRFKNEYVVMETDERFLPIIHKQLPAKHLCITNVQKDQVQRNGEPEIIRRKILSVISEDMTVYVNGDEPNALSLGEKAGRCVKYGVDRNKSSFDKKNDFFSVTAPCPICHEAIVYDHYNIDNIGSFHCPSCGFGAAANDYLATEIDFDAKTFHVGDKVYDFKYSTPYFLYCYIAALTVASEFGASSDVISEAFADFALQGGRMETVKVGTKEIKYLRMKQENPETVQSALNVIADDPTQKIFLLGLDELVDFDPHYTNTFYTFDCDFRRLIASGIERCICFSGTVAYDAGLRMLYDGFAEEKLTVLPTNDDKTIIDELEKYDCDNVYLITWLHKYEALAEYVKKLNG